MKRPPSNRRITAIRVGYRKPITSTFGPSASHISGPNSCRDEAFIGPPILSRAGRQEAERQRRLDQACAQNSDAGVASPEFIDPRESEPDAGERKAPGEGRAGARGLGVARQKEHEAETSEQGGCPPPHQVRQRTGCRRDAPKRQERPRRDKPDRHKGQANAGGRQGESFEPHDAIPPLISPVAGPGAFRRPPAPRAESDGG